MSSLLQKKYEEFVKLIFCSSNSLLYRGWEVGGVSHEIILDKQLIIKTTGIIKKEKRQIPVSTVFKKKYFSSKQTYFI